MYGSGEVYKLHYASFKKTLKTISLIDGCMVGEQRWGDGKYASSCWVFNGLWLYYIPLDLGDRLDYVHFHNELLYEKRHFPNPLSHLFL